MTEITLAVVDPFSIGLIIFFGYYGGKVLRNLDNLAGQARIWLKGLNIIVVGPPDSGKTCFYDFIRGEPLKHTVTTRRIVDRGVFTIPSNRLGDAGDLDIRGGLEIPGQIGSRDSAREVIDRKPDCLILVIDASRDGDLFWLFEFFTALAPELNAGKPLRKILRNIAIIINKVDLVNSEERMVKLKTYCLKTIEMYLGDALGAYACRVHIGACSFVEPELKLANHMLVELTEVMKHPGHDLRYKPDQLLSDRKEPQLEEKRNGVI